MKVDFFKDLELEIKEKLVEFGYPVPSFEELRKQDISATDVKRSHEHYDISNLVLHLLTIKERRIPIKKWNIHRSPKLQNQSNIDALVSMLSNGEDVNPFLSKQVKARHQTKDSKTDLLLFEWGIHHIHFVKGGQGDDMLFVYFDGDDAYLLDIMLHEKKEVGNITWTNISLIQILHDNWPNVISSYIFRNGSKEVLTTETHRTLRKEACNSTVTVKNGTEYLAIGGLITSSHHPARAKIDLPLLIECVEKLERYVSNKEKEIRQALHLHNDDIDIKLVLDENYMPKLYEEKTKEYFYLQPVSK